MRVDTFGIKQSVGLARLITITSPIGDRTLRFTDAQKDVVATSGSAWILSSGFWDDGGTWDDGAEWIDTPIAPGGSVTWKSEPGCLATSIAYYNDGTIANCEVLVSASTETDAQLHPADAIFGLYDGAAIIVELCDPTRPEAGRITLLSGFVGYCKEIREGLVSFEMRSVLSHARSVVSEQFGPMCRAEYGDDRCKTAVLPADLKRNHAYVKARSTGGTLDYNAVNDAWARVRVANAGDPSDYGNFVLECTTGGTTAGTSPDYSGIGIGSVVTDGTVVFTVRASLCRYAKIASIVDGHGVIIDRLPEPAASADGYYTLGTLILRSGDNSGASFPISNWSFVTGAPQVKFFLDTTEFIVGGEWIEIMRGCDKTEATCRNRDNNIVNRRAEPFVPGRDLLLTTIPTAQQGAGNVTNSLV